MSDIFVSYKHAERQEARQLISALTARGWTVWWDWNIPAGSQWQAELDSQLDAAGCVVALWSAESIKSDWVLYEARFAQRAGKLIQALLEPLQPPAEFASFQAVDLAGWEYGTPFHAGFDRLRAAIREQVERRAPLMTTRSGTLVRTPDAAGDLLGRDASAVAMPRARPAPVMLLPPPFRDLLDRRNECDAIAAALAERRDIALAGEVGSGKSALLSSVGNRDHTERFHDGVVYLQAATQGENDLAQAVHEAFYDVPQGVRPSAVEMRRNLADKSALLLIDDVALPPAALGALNAYGPHSAWVFASQEMLASAQRRPVVLKGLPTDDGIALFERTLSRPLRADERAMVARIVESVQGHPARIELAAGAAAVHGVTPALTELAKTPNLDDEGKRSRRVLAALACGGDVPLEVEQCAGIALVDDVQGVLAKLVRRGLVQHVVPGFRLVAGLAPQVEATPEFAACRERATDAFTRFALEARATPRRVARLAAPMMASMAWAAENGRGEEALRLARAMDGPLADSNRWDAWRDMLTRAHDIAVRAGDTSTAGWALHQQGTRAVLLGDKREGARLLREARSVRKRIGDVAGLKATSNNLKFLGWTRWIVLLAVLAGLGVTTLGAIPIVQHVLRPIATVVPNGLNFDAQDVRATARQQPLRIENKGLGAVVVIDVTLQGPNAQSFAVGTSCNGIQIPRALPCEFLVQFKPDDVGERNATIAIRLRDVKDPYLVSIRGLATVTPIAMLSTQTVDFGEVELGGGAENRSVTLRNAGSAPLGLTAIALDGDGDFRIVRETCKAATIAPDAQCTIDLRFSPREATARRATLVISDNASGSPRGVTLSGRGHATAKLEVAPGNLEFGQQEIGTQSAARSVRLRNAGTAPVEIRQLTLEGSKAFRMQGNCASVTLAPGMACALELRFAPSVIEASRGRLVIGNSAGDVRGVDLAGTGFGRPGIAFVPAQLDFGVSKRGAGVKPQRVTITSIGKAALLLRPPGIEGDARFSLVSNNCPEQLAPNGQCSVDVGFDASGAGQASARLIVRHNAAGGPAIVVLSARIEAIPPPVIERFDSNPQALERRGNVELCFRVRNAQQLTIEPAGSQPQSNSVGCVARFVGDTTTFRLTASGEGGPPQQVSSALTVRVAPPPTPPPPPPQAPVIVFLRAEPPRLQRPGETRLCFATRNAERVVIEPGGPQPTSPNEGCVSRRLSTTTTFTLTASTRGAAAQQRDVTVGVIPVAEPPKPPPPVPPKAEPPKPPPPVPPKGEPPKGGGVILKDAVKVTPGAPGAKALVGWCCRLGTVTRAQASNCAAPGQWFASEAPAKQACAPPVIR